MDLFFETGRDGKVKRIFSFFYLRIATRNAVVNVGTDFFCCPPGLTDGRALASICRQLVVFVDVEYPLFRRPRRPSVP